MLETPFRFEDGDGLPVYVEHLGNTIRFFDDGEVIRHFLGRGLRLDDKRRTKFLSTAGEPHGVTLNASGELEVFAPIEGAANAFVSYISTLLSITQWEREQNGAASDVSLFVDEVGLYLRAWKPNALGPTPPEFSGISGQTYRLDFDFDGKAVVVTTPHHAGVSSALRKMLDIRSAPSNHGVEMLVVIDDRLDPVGAKKESLVLQSVASVLPFTALAMNAGAAATTH